MTKPEQPLDRTGQRILALLRENARLSLAEIGRQVNLSAPAVADRIRRMEECGLVRGYHADVALDLLGMPILAFIRLRTPAEKYQRVLQMAETLPEILECHHITGEDAFIMKVAVASMPRLQQVIASFSPFGETATSVVLDSPKNSS